MHSIKNARFNRNFSIAYGSCFICITLITICVDTFTRKSLAIYSGILAIIGFKKAYEYNKKFKILQDSGEQ